MSKHYYGIDDFLRYCQYKPGKTLVVGSRCYGAEADRRNLYKDAVGVDLEPGDGVDIIHDLESPLPKTHKYDHIDCCSVLEHCQRPWLVADTLIKCMKPGASILLKVPFVWRVHNYPGDYWRFTIQSFDILFPGVKWEKRGYLMDDVYRKIVYTKDNDGDKFIRRAEAIGFGYLVS